MASLDLTELKRQKQRLQAPQPHLPQHNKLLDVEALRLDWQRLMDARHFSAFLTAYKLTAPLAYRQLPNAAKALAVDSLKPLLQGLAEQQLSVKMTLFNGRVKQIHRGQIHSLLDVGGGLEMGKEPFMDGILGMQVSEVWCVHKAFEDSLGEILEFFDVYHHPLMTLQLSLEDSNVRLSEKQLTQWRSLIKGLPRLKEAA